jgi:hypothetical protein
MLGMLIKFWEGGTGCTQSFSFSLHFDWPIKKVNKNIGHATDLSVKWLANLFFLPKPFFAI